MSLKLFSSILSTDKLSGKAVLNGVAALLDYGAKIIVGFLLSPLLVSGLGSNGFGIWQVLVRLIGYAQATDGRPMQALKWTIASQHTSTDHALKRQNVGSAIAILVVFFPILASVGGLLAWFSPILVHAPENYYPIVRMAAGLLVFDLILRSLSDIPKSVLTGENLVYKRMGMSASLILFGGLLTALAVHLDTGIIGVAASTVITSILTGGLYLIVVRKHVHWFGISKPVWSEVFKFAKLSGWFLIWSFVMRLIRASDVVLLGIFGSVELVTIYTLTKYLPEAIIDLIFVLTSAVAPGLGGIIGSGQLEKAGDLRGELMTLTWLSTTAIGSTVLIWNHSFVALWIGESFFAGQGATLIIVLLAVQFAFIRNDAQIIDLTLNLRQKVITGFISASLSLILAIIMVVKLNAGITGLCLGYLLGRSIMSVRYPLLAGRSINVLFFSQLRSAVRPVVVMFFMFGAASILSNQFIAHSWLTLVFFTIATGLVMALFAYYAGIQRHQRINLTRRLMESLNLLGQ